MEAGRLCTVSIHVLTSLMSVFREVNLGVKKKPFPSSRHWIVSLLSRDLRRASAASSLLRKTRGVSTCKNACGPRTGTGLGTGERPGTGVTG